MATLSGQTIANTFDSLLHVEDDTAGLVASSTDSRVIQDGVGAASALALATDSVRITSTNKLYFNDVGGEYISGDGTDLTITSGADILLSPTANVGIGNTVPGSLLEISKVSGRASLELSSWSATATAAHAGVLIFQKSGTATLNTFTGGDHTTAGEILGRIEAYGVDDDDGSTLSSYIEFANDAASDADSSPGMIKFATSDADDAGTPTVAMTIDDSQQVGIGTASPAETLHLHATNPMIRLNTTSGSGAAGINFTEGDAHRWSMGLKAGDDSFYIGEDAQYMYTNARLTIAGDSSGDVTVNTGNLIVNTAGKGIMFNPFDTGVTGPPGSDSNLLDDYEEGTFTPTLIGASSGEATYGTQGGTYTKIGRAVHVNIVMIITGMGTISGQVYFGALPFTVGDLTATSSLQATGTIGFVRGMTDDVSSVGFTANAGTVTAGLYMMDGTGGNDTDAVTTDDIDNNLTLRASLTYFE